MKLVMTMMVRDEIDIVAAVVEHHVDQGVDLLIVTDNGSVDGTTEVLQRYADLGVVELHHDPVHRKQQGEVVTAMARRARTEHGADWVINGDADEFVVASDPALTVREALERTPTDLRAFTVPVVNLVGPPAERGSGVTRLLWRDHRTTEHLVAIGIHAQPTPNAIHVGDPEVTVAQGNHFVSLTSQGQPPAEVALEVLHLPWRSWSQMEQKVLHAGRAYEASPNLRPSKNHHGMADYRRAREGRLRQAFSLRLPQRSELDGGPTFVAEDRLARSLEDLRARALDPEALSAVLASADDEPWTEAEHRRESVLGAAFLALESGLRERDEEIARLGSAVTRLRKKVRRLTREREAAVALDPATIPVRQDATRVVRRVAGGLRRRVSRGAGARRPSGSR